jgi:hypothetical protein
MAGFVLVNGWIQCGIVVHLELAVEAEAFFAGQGVGPQAVEAEGEVGPLLEEEIEAVAVAEGVAGWGGGAGNFLAGVKDFERQDGEAVEDEAGGLGVEVGGGVESAGAGEFVEEEGVDLLGEVIAELVDGVDGALDVGDLGVGGGGGAGLVFEVPEVEVGAVLAEDEGMEGLRRRGWGRAGVVPGGGRGVLEIDDRVGSEHEGEKAGFEARVVSSLGLEPRTHALKVRCSTN